MAATLPLLGGLLGLGASKLLAKKPAEAPATPAPTPVMPLADDEAIKAAKRRSLSMQMARGGRTSTILTDTSDTLGS